MTPGKDREMAPRRLGRPRDAGPSAESRTSVSCWLPAGAHDRLIALANAEERSISSLVRQFIVLQLQPKKHR